MGYYTEFHFNCELKTDTPNEVIQLLKDMCSTFMSEEEAISTPNLPDHPLFYTTERWWMMLRGWGGFAAPVRSEVTKPDGLNAGTLSIRCHFKNYDDEIEKFLDWVDPYLKAYSGEFLGFYRGEDTDEPTLVYKK